EQTFRYSRGIRRSSCRSCGSFGAETRSSTEFQSRKVLRDCQGREKRLRFDGKQFLRRIIQGQRRSESVDLCSGRILRAHYRRKQDTKIANRTKVIGWPPMKSMPNSPGVGLRLAHLAEMVATRPPMGWLEVHPENFL